MQTKVSNEEAEQIIKYLKSHLCELIFNELEPNDNDIVNLESQFIVIYQRIIPYIRIMINDYFIKLIRKGSFKSLGATSVLNQTVSSRNILHQQIAQQFLEVASNSYSSSIIQAMFHRIYYLLISKFITKQSPELKKLIQKIPKNSQFIDTTILDNLEQYKQLYSQTNLLAFENEQHKQKTFTRNTSHSNLTSSNSSSTQRLLRNSSFIDYRNSNGFVSDFKSYLQNKLPRNSSFIEPSTQSHSQYRKSNRSSSQSGNTSEQENSKIKQIEPSIYVNNVQEKEYDKIRKRPTHHSFSLLNGDDISKNKNLYIKLHGKQNNDQSQMQSLFQNKSKEITNLKEMKTPTLLPLKELQPQSQYQYQQNNLDNKGKEGIDYLKLNESNSNLNLLYDSSKNLLFDSNYQTSIFNSIKKNSLQHENLLNPMCNDSNLSSKNEINSLSSQQNEPKQIQSIINSKQSSYMQSKQQSHKSSKQLQQGFIEQNLNKNETNELIDDLQRGYGNYLKTKKDVNYGCKISISSPERKNKDLSNSKRIPLTNSQTKNVKQISNLQYAPSLNEQMNPLGYSYSKLNRSKDKYGQKSVINSKTESSPIKKMDSKFEKRENLQQYFNEIVFSHSRRQVNQLNESKSQYKLNQSFIDHCAKHSISIQNIIEQRINYMKQDKGLTFFEKPSDEKPLQNFNHTQLTKSLTPQRKKELENYLFKLGVTERPIESSQPNKSNKVVQNLVSTLKQKDRDESPPTNENIDFFAVQNINATDRSHKIDTLRKLVSKQKQLSEKHDTSPKFFKNRKSIISIQQSPLIYPADNFQDVSFIQPSSSRKQTQQQMYNKTQNKTTPIKKYTQNQLIEMMYQQDIPDLNQQQQQLQQSQNEEPFYQRPIFESPSKVYKNYLKMILTE